MFKIFAKKLMLLLPIILTTLAVNRFIILANEVAYIFRMINGGESLFADYIAISIVLVNLVIFVVSLVITDVLIHFNKRFYKNLSIRKVFVTISIAVTIYLLFGNIDLVMLMIENLHHKPYIIALNPNGPDTYMNFVQRNIIEAGINLGAMIILSIPIATCLGALDTKEEGISNGN